MRTENSIKNISISILSQVVIVLVGFISRKVFIDSLGVEYLGINGFLTNILSMMGLVEGGIGVSIVYNLYKPLAENDTPKIISLVQLYKKIYSILAVSIGVLCICIFPFMKYMIKQDTSIPYIGVIYFIFVSKNIISYLNAHKWSLINADQKGYVIAKYNIIFDVSSTLLKMIILYFTGSYILFLLIETIIFIFQNIWNGKVVNLRYPYIKTKLKYYVEDETKKNIVVNVRALFLHKIGSYCVFGTDNILIATFVNLKSVGLYSNYTMIMGQLEALLNPIVTGVGASVGNLIALESKEKMYDIFKIVHFIGFWIYSLSAIFLFNLLEPFITWWLGKGLLLDRLTFGIVLLNFYITGMRYPIWTFKTKAGIFVPDRYVPLLEAVINLGSSLILVKWFGLAGIFMGTTISTVSLTLWTQAKLVYNNIFDKSIFLYFKEFVQYGVLTLLTGIVTSFICKSLISGDGFIHLIYRGLICVTVPNIIYCIIFYKSDEFKYLREIAFKMIYKIKGRVFSKVNEFKVNMKGDN